MKNNSNFIHIYSKAFFAVLKKSEKKIFQMMSECQILQIILKENPLIMTILKQMSKSEQKNFFAKITEKSINSLWKNFFYILIDDQKLFLLFDILVLLQKKIEIQLGIKRGTIFSAVKLTISQIKQLNNLFNKILNKKVFLENQIDRKLIGGLRVEIDQLSWDNSIAGQLKNLHQELLK